MLRPTYPEVLTSDWLPPTALARQVEVQTLVQMLDPDFPPRGPARVVAVHGPSGSGTSIVARRAARELVDRVRTNHAGPLPLTATVRVRCCRGTLGVASALLQRLDEGFHGRGFPVVEILAGFLRRLRRENRPCIVVLEDIDIAGPSITPVLRALGSPDRFLPEGEGGLPPLWAILAGLSEPVAAINRELPALELKARSIALRPYSREEIYHIVEERARRALGIAPPPELARRVTERTLREGGGARRAIDLLRRELSLPATVAVSSLGPLREGWFRGNLEPRILCALDRACQGTSASVGTVRAWEARLARESGDRPLAATTFWRRMIRLEQSGVLRREVRAGGNGGTRTTIHLLVPLEEWARGQGLREIHPAFASASVSPGTRSSPKVPGRDGFPSAADRWPPFVPGALGRAPMRPAVEI
jgi:AAA ATPase domain